MAMLHALVALALLTFTGAAAAQQQTVTRVVPVGYCQLTSLGSSAAIDAATCVRASFTGTGAGTALTAASVTGTIRPGDQVAGTGVVAGTTIVRQTSGVTGGAGVYVTSRPTTASADSLTAGGVPSGATSAYIAAEAQAVRYRDDGGTPTASVGMPIASGAAIAYVGTFSALRFIEQAGGAKLNVLFYR